MSFVPRRDASRPAPRAQAGDVGGDDIALLDAVKRGHRDAARAFHDRYGRLIERVIARIVGVDQELPDLVQDALLRALNGLGQVRDGQALPDWVMRVAVSTATDCLRRRRTRRRFLSMFETSASRDEVRGPTTEIDETSGQALRATYAILKRLSIDERVAFVLRTVDGRKLTEIAAACDCSLATIKRTLLRAEAKFTKMARRDPVLLDWVGSTSEEMLDGAS